MHGAMRSHSVLPTRSKAKAVLLGSMSAALVSLAAIMPGPGRAAELTIQQGVVVKFGERAGLVVRDKLTTGTGTILTSAKEDEVGQAPAAGDWLGLRIEKTSASHGLASYNDLLIRYAGGDYAGRPGAAFSMRGVSHRLDNIRILDGTTGLRLVDGASPVITGSSFMRNQTGIEASDNSRPTVGSTQFVGNSIQAVLNNTPSTIITATGNWWGHATGPKDLVANPGGQGDVVSAGVDYANYLVAVPLINPALRLAAPAPYYASSRVELELSCVNATEYRVAENGAFTGVAFKPLPNARLTIDYDLSPGDGRKALDAQFRDSNGNMVSATLTGGVLIDSQVPAVNITNPAPGSLIKEPIVIEATASDASGVKQVQFLLGAQLLATDSSAPYAHNWNTAAVADGNYSIRAVATDEAGRTSEHSVSVVVSRAAPVPDTEGPQLTNIMANGSALADGRSFDRNTVLSFSASDRSAISRIELLLDGAVKATASSTGSGTFSVPLNLNGVANGTHALVLRALDSLGNTSTFTYTINVAHAPPTAPLLSQPANGMVTRTAALAVSGSASAGNNVQLHVNGEASGPPITAGSDGKFTGTVLLVSGENLIQATASDQYGTSALSAGRTVILDTSVPSSPSNLAASVSSGGKIRLNWVVSGDPNVVANEIYRATSEFTSIEEGQKVARVGKAVATYEDAPASDGRYFYRVVAVNAAGAPSLPTNLANASIDRTLPYAVRVEYIPQGAHDAGNQIFGQGRIDVRVTVSEPLSGAPYLSIVPAGGLSLPVDLVKRDDLHYEGALTLSAGVGTGTANVLFSARDMVGNRGVEVHEGATLNIDTVGPSVEQIALTPSAPIKVDSGREVTAVVTFDEPLASGETPAFQYQLSGNGRLPVSVANPVRIDALTWRLQFELPADAGQTVETFSLTPLAEDALGNVSSRVMASNVFQVYQGDLPALNVPLGLTATALPGGQIRLAWQPVDGAGSYQIYRRSPGESALVELSRSDVAQATDSVPADGIYRYAVASIRTSNGQETISGQSPVAEVTASRTAPGAPQNLQLSLTPQGVLATWQPPVGSLPASYRLYRAATGTITSVAGLTPLKEGIRTNQAVDASPSQDEHAYVVTALDVAGNESAISNSVYLNFSLLPVKTLRVEQIGTDYPVLSWTPHGSGAIGYDVYVGEGESRFKLTAAPIVATTFTDTGFTGGERRYTVETVDANGERMARGIVLANTSMQVVSGLPLKRNIMNRVSVQVTNLSSVTLNATTVGARIGSRDFRSEPFTLAGNATRVVPLVVGGYPDLPNPAALTLVLESKASEGELMRIGRQQQANVVDSALTVGIEAENFTRGGTGRVRLSVENTTDVEVELLTARNFGSNPSDELRLKLIDNDGNLLSTIPYKQATGAGVITLSNGQTVARIAPGQRYVSDVFQMPVPTSAPDRVRLKLEVDKLRYSSGQPEEVSIPGMGSERVVDLVETPYYGEVVSIDPVVSYGNTEVTIQGRAVDRATQAPVPNAPLKIAFNQEGFERLADVVTDGAGAFRYVFKPTLTDAGLYRVGAIHPDMTDRPAQASFTINRVEITPASFKMTVPRNYAYRIEFRAKTGTGSQASNVRVVYAPEYQPSGSLPQGIAVTPSAAISIAPKQNLALPVSVSGDNTAAPSGRLVLAVFSDGSGATPLALLPVDYVLTEAKPALYATPNFVEAGLSQGQSVIEQVVIENKGFVAMNDVVAELVDASGNAAPGWISLASSPTLGTIGIGEKRPVDLNIAPGTGVAEGVYEFKLRLSGGNLPTENVNIFVSVTQSGIGNVLFKASDIYTATRDKNGNLIPGLAGARIFLQNELVVSQSYELTTDAFGEAYFQGLPAGSYRFKASAQNHQEAGGRVSIKPGLTVNQPVFLEYTLIQVEWSVREITIEDRYEITLNATFETDVPAPVVMLQPTSINLPKMAPGEVFQGELVLTNYGLVRADNVVADPPVSDQYYKFEFLAQPPTSLEAKQRVRLPYRVIALSPYGGDAASAGEDGAGDEPEGTEPMQKSGAMAMRAPATSDGSSDSVSQATPMPKSGATATGQAGCYSYTARYPVRCDFVCANGTVSKQCGSSANWFYVDRTYCPAGPGQGGSGGAGGGAWGGSGSPSYTGMPGVPICAKGDGECYDPQSKQSGGSKEGGQ